MSLRLSAGTSESWWRWICPKITALSVCVCAVAIDDSSTSVCPDILFCSSFFCICKTEVIKADRVISAKALIKPPKKRRERTGWGAWASVKDHLRRRFCQHQFICPRRDEPTYLSNETSFSSWKLSSAWRGANMVSSVSQTPNSHHSSGVYAEEAHRQTGSPSGSGYGLLLLLCCTSLNCLEIVESSWEITHESIPLDLLLPLEKHRWTEMNVCSKAQRQKSEGNQTSIQKTWTSSNFKSHTHREERLTLASSLATAAKEDRRTSHGVYLDKWKESSRTEENECGKGKGEHPSVNAGGGHLVSKAEEWSVIFTCSEGDEDRGMEPNCFRCLFVSFASWLVECWICCLWTHHQSENNLPASSTDTRAQQLSHTLQSTFH